MLRPYATFLDTSSSGSLCADADLLCTGNRSALFTNDLGYTLSFGRTPNTDGVQAVAGEERIRLVGSLPFAGVPEPNTALLLATGLAVLTWRMRRA